nr:hypothetical protein [Tanacetum cinerariifolium]
MEYLVKINKNARIPLLKRKHLKITVLTTNTPYPSRKIRRIYACTSEKTTKETKSIRHMAPLAPCDHRHVWLRYQVEGYTKEIVHDFKQRLETILERIGSEMGLDVDDTFCLQLGGARRSMTWRQFILALGLFEIHSLLYIHHRSGSEAVAQHGSGAANVPYLLAQYLFSHAEGRKSGVRLSEGHFIGRLAHHFGDEWAWVAQGAKWQPVDAATALGGAKDALGPRCKEIDKVGEVSIIWNPMLKKDQEKDKNEKRGEAGKSLKQLQ